jgi:hypothetical protein
MSLTLHAVESDDLCPVARPTPTLWVLATLLFLAFGGAPAVAAPLTAEQTFNFTGAVQTFTVPVGVTTLHVIARGAQGADSIFTDPSYNGPLATGGRGAVVTGDLTVTPGQTLYVYVGGKPTGVGGCYNGAKRVPRKCYA